MDQRLYDAVLDSPAADLLEVLAVAVQDKAAHETKTGSHIVAAYLSDASRALFDLAEELNQ